MKDSWKTGGNKMNSYKFDDKEVGAFYNEITGKKHKSARRDVSCDFSSASEKANILSALKVRLINAGKYNEASTLIRAITKIQSEAGDIIITNPVKGEEAISGRLTRDMRTFVSAVESIINDKPNEFARYIFA